MNKPNCEVFEIIISGGGKDSRAFTYQLKQPCDILNIFIDDKNKCWDVIVYNRFFYDNEDELDSNDELLIR